MSLILPRRRLLLGALAAPAIIRAAHADMDWIDGFPGNLRRTSYPDYRPSMGRRWNTGRRLARGLQFGIHVAPFGLNQAYDFVNEIDWYQQNSGTTGTTLGGVTKGSGIRFTSASSGYLTPSVSESSTRKNAAYQMVGAMSLLFVGNFPVGAASTGGVQCVWFSGDGAASDYQTGAAFFIADRMYLNRAATSGANYYSGQDNGAGGATNYAYSQLTTFGVSQDGVFPAGELTFYREGKPSSGTVTHDMSVVPTTGSTYYIGAYEANSSKSSYFNGVGSMIYGWNRVLDANEFMEAHLDPWWALRMDQTPAVASYYPGTGAVPSSRGLIIQ